MGSCLSKKNKTSPSITTSTSTSTSTSTKVPPDPSSSNNGFHPISVSHPQELLPPPADLKPKTKKKTEQENGGGGREERGECPVKKEVFVIKHRKSHDGRDRNNGATVLPEEGNVAVPSSATPAVSSSSCEILDSGAAGEGLKVGIVRTSSCTKEEVDAILIQCGRLSRSSSGKGHGRKYSGSKRSYDFDHCDRDGVNSGGFGDEDDDGKNPNSVDIDDGGTPAEKRHHHRQRHRQSSRPSSSSQGRRRTPSRERDQNQRSSSRERRVSRSPGRRSAETSTPNASNNTSNVNANTNNGGVRPAKMVSVPATVSHTEMDRSNNNVSGGINDSATAVKRISVKRNVGGEATAMAGSRVASSPRSQSPARTNANAKLSDENQQQQPSLSRSSSRKAEQSPYRRNPLSEIDTNTQPNNRTHNRSKKETEELIAKDSINSLNQKSKTDSKSCHKVVVSQVNGSKAAAAATRGVVNIISSTMQEEKMMMDGVKEKSPITYTAPLLNTEVVVIEHQKPQALTRSRSARQLRELDINPEALLNQSQTPSYTKMLLQDIQNFHQKSVNTVSLPACVTKACSIVEAVADLNSTTSSSFSEDRSNPPTYQSSRNDYNASYGGNLGGKGVSDSRHPFVESEVAMDDDIMEPSFHKYVTVRRGGPMVSGGGDTADDQESSGSNSFVGSIQQQHWGVSTASWEPNSADSTDSWTSRKNTREEGHPNPGSGSSFRSKSGIDTDENRRRTTTERRRDSDSQRSSGIGRGRLGSASKVSVAATGSI